MKEKNLPVWCVDVQHYGTEPEPALLPLQLAN